jgi:hypothetical protein
MIITQMGTQNRPEMVAMQGSSSAPPRNSNNRCRTIWEENIKNLK